MDLVDESDEHQEEGVDVVPCSNLFLSLVVHNVGHAHQRGQRDELVSPLASMKSCLVMVCRSTLWLRNGLINACGWGVVRERE